MAEEVLVNFKVDYSEIDKAIETLNKAGVVDAGMASQFRNTNAEINKQSTAIKATSAATTQLNTTLDTAARSTRQLSQQLLDALKAGTVTSKMLKDAGLTYKQFVEIAGKSLKTTGEQGVKANKELKNSQDQVGESADTLRNQLFRMTEQLQQMRLAGETNSEGFRQLEKDTAHLKQVLKDTSEGIRHLASDTPIIDGLIGGVRVFAGAMAAAQGAAGLFGVENENVQKTLLKVTSAMSFAIGIQEVFTNLTKKSAFIKGIDILLTNAQTAAQFLFAGALAGTSGALRVFRTVLISTGIGAVVVALGFLVGELLTFIQRTTEANKAQALLNTQLEIGAGFADDSANAFKKASELKIAALQREGASQQAINEEALKSLDLQIGAAKEFYDKASASSENLLKKKTHDDKKYGENYIKALDITGKAADKYYALIDEREKERLRISRETDELLLKSRLAIFQTTAIKAREGSQAQLDAQKVVIAGQAQLDIFMSNSDEEKTRIFEKSVKDQEDLQKAFNKRQIELRIQQVDAEITAAQTLRLTNEREGAALELSLQKRRLKLQAQADTETIKLSEAEKKAIRDKSFQERLKLEAEFNLKLRQEAIDDQISRNNAELSLLKTNDEDKLILQIANLDLIAQREVDAAGGVAARIKEINAKRDADVLALRKQFIETALDLELKTTAAREGAEVRSLQRILTEQEHFSLLETGLEQKRRDAVVQRIVAVNRLGEIELQAIGKRLAALKEEKDNRLISDKDYNIQYAQLLDDELAVTEATETKITDIVRAENKRRQEATVKSIQTILDVSNKVADTIQQLNDLQTASENQRLQADRNRVDQLLQAGAITQKEADRRNKRLDVEEKRLREIQAKRDKDTAIFKAALAIPQAFLTGLLQGGPIVGAIYAALAAVELAIIVARPIPKFKRGKKAGGYEGLGEIGEAGSELVERGGKMYVAKKPTVVWLAKEDVVYDPQQTRSMLQNGASAIDQSLMAPAHTNGHTTDYEKVAKIIAKEIQQLPGVNLSLDRDGFNLSVQRGLDRINYMAKRYSSK